VVSVADEFCQFVLKNPDSPGMSPREALERLTALYRNVLEPEYLKVLERNLSA
jgi:HD-GYP domain-containing protein (c-di-GMP phosphodiesterase class II)